MTPNLKERHLAANETEQFQLPKDEPWLALNMSRATWYRLGKPTLPRKRTLVELARLTDVSLRTIQRTAARQKLIERFAPDLSDLLISKRHAQPESIIAARVACAMSIIANILEQFRRERRNDTSAQAIADHIDDPIYNLEIVKEALAHIGLTYGQ